MPHQEGFTTGSENMLVAPLVELSLSTFFSLFFSQMFVRNKLLKYNKPLKNIE